MGNKEKNWVYQVIQLGDLFRLDFKFKGNPIIIFNCYFTKVEWGDNVIRLRDDFNSRSLARLEFTFG